MSTNIKDFEYGVIDEDNEIIALFNSENDAKIYAQFRNQEEQEVVVVELYFTEEANITVSF